MNEYILTIDGVVLTGPYANEMKQRLTEHILRFEGYTMFKFESLNVNLKPTEDDEEVGYGTPS